jgi:hypothetical protein
LLPADKPQIGQNRYLHCPPGAPATASQAGRHVAADCGGKVTSVRNSLAREPNDFQRPGRFSRQER